MGFIVSNTTPLRYLIEIKAVFLLPSLFDQVIIPNAVRDELTHSQTPKIVTDFIVKPPGWLTVRPVQTVDQQLQQLLHPGEQAAILLATELNAPAILLDERQARYIAQQRGLRPIGTFYVLEVVAPRT